MPRSRGGGRPAPARQQTRSSSTMAAPARSQAPPPAQAPAHPQQQAPSQGGGMFSQMASTAAGVAVGSAVGHTLANGVSSIFGGGSSAPAEPQQQAVQQSQAYNQQEASRACEVDARNFTKCLDEQGGNMQICDWYLQQLKACQEASRSY